MNRKVLCLHPTNVTLNIRICRVNMKGLEGERSGSPGLLQSAKRCSCLKNGEAGTHEFRLSWLMIESQYPGQRHPVGCGVNSEYVSERITLFNLNRRISRFSFSPTLAFRVSVGIRRSGSVRVYMSHQSKRSFERLSRMLVLWSGLAIFTLTHPPWMGIALQACPQLAHKRSKWNMVEFRIP